MPIDGVVLPGDVVTELSELSEGEKVVLGPGLRRDTDGVMVTKCGILRKKDNRTYWVDNRQKRYIPTRGENVIGTVTAKMGDFFKVDIGGSEQASLSYLSFEGATKRNRPNVQVGSLIYAKLLVASKDMEPELVCVDGNGKSMGLGVLPDGGYVFHVPLHLVRRLLSQECNLMKTIGARIPFEAAVGMNGRVWVKSQSAEKTISIYQVISSSENLSDETMDLRANTMLN